MIDIGANLSSEQFKGDIEAVLMRAKEAGLTHIILTGTGLSSFHENKDIIKKFDHILNLFNTLGLHPHHAIQQQEFFSQFDSLISDPKIVSLGEFGLDYFRMLSPKNIQQQVMITFLNKAKTLQIPLFMHERDSSMDFISILKENPSSNKKIIHCFTGNTDTVKQYLDLDCFIGITGWCTDTSRGEMLREAISYIPLDKMMIETDCPYLTPKNKKPYIHRNEPSFLMYVAQSISEIKKISIQEVIHHTQKNSMDIFQLSQYNKNKVKL